MVRSKMINMFNCFMKRADNLYRDNIMQIFFCPFILRCRQAILDQGKDPPAMFGLTERYEEIWLPEAEKPILLDHRTPELQLVQRIRDEAHRFGIIHHRTLRGKAFTHSQLDEIPGIGPVRRKELLKAFGSIKAIREATREELLKVKGMNATAADAILNHQFR